jgi:hypothetical protein
MSELYVSQVLLEIDGKNITDFKSVEEKEYEIHRPVNLMNTTGHIETKSRYGANVEYVVPKDGHEFDFTKVKGGKLTIDLQNGKRIQYSGVYVLKIGATKYDGDKEATRLIEFSAKNRKE